MQILIIEDNIAVAGMIISALQEAGHGVVGHGRSVDQSLQLVSQCACDAAILDVDLMGENSGPVAEELLRMSIPFVVMTGAARMLLPAHRDAPLVLKPFRMNRLLKSLASIRQ